jgi:hypothetical protein
LNHGIPNTCTDGAQTGTELCKIYPQWF